MARPTKYTSDKPNKLYNALAQGRSVTQFAAECGACRATIYNWAEEHPEFLDALTRGQEASEAHWESELQQMMRDPKVNAPLVKLYFANRFGWSDKQEYDHRSGDRSMSPQAQVTDEDLDRRIRELTGDK